MNIWKIIFSRSPAIVGQIKGIIRESTGAADFVSKVEQAGFRRVKEDFVGLYLQKGDCTLIVNVLASRGSDRIWCLSMIASKTSEIVNLIDEGETSF
jgi:hypothetical protein